MSTGLTPTSSAVGMFEPVTMTRSAVAAALDAGTRFPCASRATGPWAPGEGEGEGIAAVCAGTSGIMAKKIASRTALLRNNPHSGSWALFIYFVLLGPTNTQNACRRSILFLLFFYLRRCRYNYHNNEPTKPSQRIQVVQHVVRRCSAKHTGDDVLIRFALCPVLHGANWHPIKNCVYSEDGNCC